MGLEKWYVERLDFDEKIMQYRWGGAYTFDSDEALVDFLKNYVSSAGLKHVWRITRVVR